MVASYLRFAQICQQYRTPFATRQAVSIFDFSFYHRLSDTCGIIVSTMTYDLTAIYEVLCRAGEQRVICNRVGLLRYSVSCMVGERI
mgnify:CR=1 FL=1